MLKIIGVSKFASFVRVRVWFQPVTGSGKELSISRFTFKVNILIMGQLSLIFLTVDSSRTTNGQ